MPRGRRSLLGSWHTFGTESSWTLGCFCPAVWPIVLVFKEWEEAGVRVSHLFSWDQNYMSLCKWKIIMHKTEPAMFVPVAQWTCAILTLTQQTCSQDNFLLHWSEKPESDDHLFTWFSRHFTLVSYFTSHKSTVMAFIYLIYTWRNYNPKGLNTCSKSDIYDTCAKKA